MKVHYFKTSAKLFCQCFISVFLLCLIFLTPSYSQTVVDPLLLAEINNIQAIDNHAHPLTVNLHNEDDKDFDVLPLEGLNSLLLPIRLLPDNSEYLAAWQTLYGYNIKVGNEHSAQEVVKLKSRLMAEKGENYPSWILHQLGIEVMLSNRVAMGRGLRSSSFKWVSFVDPMLFPLNNSVMRKTPDYDYFYTYEEKSLKRYLAEANLSRLPKTFDDYLKKFVTATLERHKRDGAVAIKFEVALLRSLDFDDVNKSAAKRVYERYINGARVPAQAYKILQDYIFRYIAGEAGRLDLAVHIHVISGPGGFYNISGSNPLNLENVFNDKRLKTTNFVIVHGGWPFVKEMGVLMQGKSNVYADFSAQTFLLYPRALSEVLRSWLELAPDKILFGTDAFPVTPFNSWEENCWLTTTTARQALAMALTSMINDAEIDREQALELARKVLRKNAISLYKLKL